MSNSLLYKLSDNFDLSKIMISGLKTMFVCLLLFSMGLVVFVQADRIAVTFLDDYFWLLIIGFAIGGLLSVIAQKRA